ncbi:hypothetical protein KEM48_009715 [Puccinia striiformis f. sp. tritici PST-130]|nr:hypothetical protein Pst134EB_005804 [Puccinia striiformis f. sp. tritici]KAI9623095.1 hypothetical protein KEM48_009715 [Puccinia striiformis f. sp. tritici PST-130]
MAPRPSLHQFLNQALQSVPTDEANPRTFELLTLATKPFRTFTLFPHALNPTVSIMRTDYLITLAEKFEDYRPKDDTISTPSPEVTVPVFGLEASLYTISTTAVQLLYISKIDTTGLAPLPAPSGQLTTVFLSYFLQHMPKSIQSLRIHIFARASREGQYLFPASAENAPNGTGDGAKFASKFISSARGGKRILDDQQLVKWWHKVLSQLALGYHQASKTIKNSLECFYILPGFDHEESLEVLPLTPELKALWNYGHPYHKIRSPCTSAHQDHSQQPSKVGSSDRARSCLLSELIPAFNDDPKARFLHSIGNCSTNPSGEPGDWDDAIGQRSSSSLESDRNRERIKINNVSSDEFWDRMGGRQECCDGRVSAFFVVALSRSSTLYPPSVSSSIVHHDQHTKNITEPISTIALCQEDVQSLFSTNDSGPLPTGLTDSDEVQKRLVSVSRNVWVSLWSKIHNKDYSKLENLTSAYKGWIADVESCINSAILDDHLKKQRKLQEKINNTTNDDDNNRKIDDEVLAIDDKNKKKTNDGKSDPSSSGFLDCYSIVLVNNLRKNSSQNDVNVPGSDSNHLKRTTVNVLQPRKKSKK